MAVKTIKIIIAEGRHDTAFISRVMKANGYIDPETKVNQIEPKFLSDYIVELFKDLKFSRNLADMERHRHPVPSFLLSRDIEGGKEIALLFASDGLGNHKNVTRILSYFINRLHNEFGLEDVARESVDKIKVIFNADADDKGIDVRIASINECIQKLKDNTLGGKIKETFAGVGNYGKCEYMGLTWGAFISANDKGYGTLEDFVLPLFEDGRDDLCKEVEAFVQKKDLYKIPQTGKYNEQKIRIGLMGQIDMPGVSNSVLIDQSMMIAEEMLQQGIYEKIGTYIREF